MSYSFQRWNTQEKRSDAKAAPSTSEESTLSKELQALQNNLSVNLAEGLKLYQNTDNQTQQAPHQANTKKTTPTHQNTPPAPQDLTEKQWDHLASLVANQVLTYMLDNTLQAELHKLQFKVDEYYTDNREMAEHIRQLVNENETLKQSVKNTEKQISNFKHIFSKFYIKL